MNNKYHGSFCFPLPLVSSIFLTEHIFMLCSRLYRDVQHILGCIRSLPSDNLGKSSTPNSGQLDEFLVKRFGTEAG